MKQHKSSRKYASYSVLYTVLAVAIVIMANLFINTLPAILTRFDVTANELFTLSQETRDRLDGVDQDITLYLLAETGSEDAAIVELLGRYEAENPHIHVEYKDPVLYPYFASQYTNLILETNSVIAVSSLRATAINYADFYPQSYDEDYNIIAEFDGENLLTSAIVYVSSDKLPTIYSTTGHGELPLPDSLISRLEQECYTVSELDLLTVNAVPEDTAVLLIHAPLNDFTGDETSKIAAWLENGGRLMLLTDILDEPLANLNALMSNYSVYPETGIVLEGNSNYHLSEYPHYLFPNMADTAVTAPLSDAGYRVMTALCHPLNVEADLRDGLSVTRLLTTSDSAYLKEEAHNTDTLEYVDGDKQGSFTLSLLIEEAQTRIIWFGTSMITDEVSDSIVNGSNTDLLLNSFNWLSEQNSGLTIRSRSLNSGYLVMTSMEANLWQTVMAIILPLIFMGVGLVVWYIRRKR